MSNTNSWHDDMSNDAALVKARRAAAAKKASEYRIVPHVMLHGKEHKSCCSCCVLKPLTDFGSRKDSHDGLNGTCKGCCAESARERRARKAVS